jgi:hypothetical protein
MKLGLRTVHHTTETKETCISCGKPFLMYWYDAEETSGRSETMHGFSGKQKHANCIERETGRPPLSLRDVNIMRRMGMSKEEYYKSKGY